jgi:hypothetical protein
LASRQTRLERPPLLLELRDVVTVIPGHGQPVSNSTELTEYRDILVAIRAAVTDKTIAYAECTPILVAPVNG